MTQNGATMGRMTETPGSVRVTSPLPESQQPCGECGAAVADWTAHTAWHAGSGQADGQAAVLEFLDSIDPGALEQAVLGAPGMGQGSSPMVVALDVLKRFAANGPAL